MYDIKQEYIKTGFPGMLKKRWVYHLLFWVVMYLMFSLFDSFSSGQPFINALREQWPHFVTYMAIVYLNLSYLIPTYLSKKRFLPYLLLLLLSSIIITPFKVLYLYHQLDNQPVAQAQLLQQLNLAFIPTFLMGLFSTLLKIISDWFKNLRERQELLMQNMQSELRFLRSQINPHFLFNTLNNLYALTLKKSELAPEIVLKLSEMMRYMLYESNEKEVPLANEIAYLRNYLDLEKFRKTQDFSINFRVEGSPENKKIVPLLFIPFIENAFKHGLSQHTSHGFIDILLRIENNRLYFRVENSKGNSPASQTQLPQQRSKSKSGGIGLANVRRRLELLYPKKHKLKIQDKKDIFVVDLQLTLDSPPDNSIPENKFLNTNTNLM